MTLPMTPRVVPTSDEEGWRWARKEAKGGVGPDLRGMVKGLCGGHTLWHEAGRQGRTDICRFLAAQGLGAEINVGSEAGGTPLDSAIFWRNEETARWMVANGADVAAMNHRRCTIFARVHRSAVDSYPSTRPPDVHSLHLLHSSPTFYRPSPPSVSNRHASS